MSLVKDKGQGTISSPAWQSTAVAAKAMVQRRESNEEQEAQNGRKGRWTGRPTHTRQSGGRSGIKAFATINSIVGGPPVSSLAFFCVSPLATSSIARLSTTIYQNDKPHTEMSLEYLITSLFINTIFSQ